MIEVDKSLQVVMIYILTHLGLIFFMYPSNIIDSTEEGHWIPIFISVIFHLIIVLLYLKGLSLFPGKNIMTIYSLGGKGFLLFFLLPVFLYFIMATIITVRAYSEIITIIFLANTPLWAILALFLALPCYLAVKGLKAILRTGLVISFLFLPLVFFILVTSFQNADFYYVFPLWNNDFSFIKELSYLKSFFAIGGGFLFLGFIQPTISFQSKKILIAIAVIIPCFVLSVYIPILTFGQATASTFLFPFVLALDAINISWLMFDRVTLFFLLSLITFIMLYISLVLWKAASIVTHSFSFLKPTYILLILSILIYIICLFIPNWSDVETLFKWNTFLRFYVLITVPLSIYLLGLFFKPEGSGTC